MALKVKAVERNIKFTKDENDPGVWRYVMQPDLYIALNQAKVIREAALRSGVSQGVMKACWDAAGEVIKAWATEGHSVALPGLGSMRFGLRAKSVAKVEDVKTSLISTRRIIFTPTQDLKDELSNTAIQITCYGLSDGHHDHELHGFRTHYSLKHESPALEVLSTSILLLILALRVCAHLYDCY